MNKSAQPREPHPIRAFRNRRGLSLLTVASQAHISEAALSRIENGGTELPNITIIAQLAIASEGEVSAVDIFRWHYAAATGVVAPLRAPMTRDYQWTWISRPGSSAPASA